jgi:Ca2+-binding RTX toxin-like protein
MILVGSVGSTAPPAPEIMAITSKSYVATIALTGSGSHFDPVTSQNEIFSIFFTATLTATLRFDGTKLIGGSERIVVLWTSDHTNAGRDSSGHYDEVRGLNPSGNRLIVGDGTPSVSTRDFLEAGIGDWVEEISFLFSQVYLPSSNRIDVDVEVDAHLPAHLNYQVVANLDGDFDLLPPGPNLSIDGFIFNGSIVTYEVENSGNKTAAASTSGLYLSTDATIDVSDKLLATRGEGTLAAGQSELERILPSFPSNLDPGTYYLGVIADIRQTVKEGSEADNDSRALRIMLGDSAANKLTGSSGRDTIVGLAGNDTIAGGTNADTLVGGVGNDRLTGGAGADKFVFTHALNASTNVDRISDFLAPSDTFVLENAIFKTLATGALPAGKFHVGTVAHDANDRVIYNPNNGKLLFDVDGLGGKAGVVFATVAAHLPITHADFLIV